MSNRRRLRACPTPPADRAVLRASSIADLLDAVAVMLGFHPSESLVAVQVEGPRRRLTFCARVDVPDLDCVDAAAVPVVEALRRQRAETALLIAFSADEVRADAAVAQTSAMLRESGVRILDALRADGQRYWSYQCDDPRCCPPEGVPYDSRAGELLTRAVVSGAEVLAGREELQARLLPAPGFDADAMRAAVAKVMPQVRSVREDRAACLQAVDRAKLLVSAALDDPDRVLDVDEVAWLQVHVSVIIVRDVVWNLMTRSAADAHLALWSQVLRRTVFPFEPAVACLTGFAAWLRGDGATAWCALDRAAAADPDYSMAKLLARALEGAVHPGTWSPCPERQIMAVLDRRA